MRGAIRAENAEAVIFANYSANRTWYFPDCTWASTRRRIATPSTCRPSNSTGMCPGDALYQQFCCAFMQGVTRERGATRLDPAAVTRHLGHLLADRDSTARA